MELNSGNIPGGNSLSEILQRDLENFMDIEGVALEIRQQIIEAWKNGASIEPGKWTLNLPITENRPFVIPTDKAIISGNDAGGTANTPSNEDIREMNHHLLDTFSALRKAISRRDFEWLEKQDGYTPDLSRNLKRSRCEIFQAYSERLKSSVWNIWERQREDMHRQNDWSGYPDVLSQYFVLHQAFFQLKLAGHAYRFGMDYAAILADRALKSIATFLEASVIPIPEEQ